MFEPTINFVLGCICRATFTAFCDFLLSRADVIVLLYRSEGYPLGELIRVYRAQVANARVEITHSIIEYLKVREVFTYQYSMSTR